mgnify:CR=1 FL=1
MKINITVPVAKETYELGQGINKFVGTLKKALADGFQVGQDLPIIVTSAIAELVPSLQGMEQIPVEAKEDLPSFMKGLTLSAEELAFSLLGK